MVSSLVWGRMRVLDRMVVRPVLECCIYYIAEEDNMILESLGFWHEKSGWLMSTGVGLFYPPGCCYQIFIAA